MIAREALYFLASNALIGLVGNSIRMTALQREMTFAMALASNALIGLVGN
jgi:hypothetical protein